jgi:hypothetical protein
MATFFSFYAVSGALAAVGLLGLALLLPFAFLRSIAHGYEARIRRLEEELARREQPVP